MKKLLIIIIVIIVIAAAVAAAWITQKEALAPVLDPPIACTQEAKQCPDGSYVGRTGPNCEFELCP